MTTHIASAAQWRQVTAASSIVVTDFYADWCGPCKVIAPTFESLATKYAKPNRITFAKVDVDNNREVAQLYNVRAMPTFVILKNGSVIDTIQGANPQALTAAVEKAVKLAGPGSGASFQIPGRTLGGETPTVRIGGGATRPSGNPIQGRTSSWDLNNIINAVIAFVGLYLTSLLTFDPYMAAQNSRFNEANHQTAPIRVAPGAPFSGRSFASTSSGSGSGSASGSKPSGSSSGAAKPQAKPAFRTLADLGQ